MNKVAIVVNAAIVKGNKYLLTKRYDPHDKLVHDRWQMPGGGVNYKEKLADALQRELKEELGQKVKILALVPGFLESISERKYWHGIVITYLCKLQDKDPKIKLNNEASDYGWFTLSEMKKMRMHYGTLEELVRADKLRQKLGVEERT